MYNFHPVLWVEQASKMETKLVATLLLSLLSLAGSAPQGFQSGGRYYNDVGEVIAAVNAARDAQQYQRNLKPDGTRKYNNVDEVMADLKRPYHPNIGFYKPLDPPLTGLTDPRCTRQGKLGCGDRCFIPLNTRCIRGQVIGPEQSIDGALLPSIGSVGVGLIGAAISGAAQIGVAAIGG